MKRLSAAAIRSRDTRADVINWRAIPACSERELDCDLLDDTARVAGLASITTEKVINQP